MDLSEAPKTHIKVANEELRTTREAAREIGAMLRQLERGQLEKIVLTSRGQMVGILLSPERYAAITRS